MNAPQQRLELNTTMSLFSISVQRSVKRAAPDHKHTMKHFTMTNSFIGISGNSTVLLILLSYPHMLVFLLNKLTILPGMIV